LLTSFKEANSSAVKRKLFPDTERDVYFKRAMGIAFR